MKTLKGRVVVAGRGEGPALVTRMPINFTAALTKFGNILPGRQSLMNDRHHDLYKKRLKGRVVIFPSCIGSTYTGMVLLELMYKGEAPAAMIVRNADSLLVSGSVLAKVWFGNGVPIVEVASDEIFDIVRSGDRVEVNGETGEIMIH